MLKGLKSFMEQVLWPEFQELNSALVSYLSEITEKVIREEVTAKLVTPMSSTSRRRSDDNHKAQFQLDRAEMTVDIGKTSNMLEGSHSNERVGVRFAHFHSILSPPRRPMDQSKTLRFTAFLFSCGI